MNDPMFSMALSVQSNKGVFALLLGSGVSRSAGIMTGWDIVLDLVRKLAHMQGKECEPDPAAWFAAEYGKEPDYSELLGMVAKTPATRSGLLRPYFEPTAEEREQGKKIPTAAHKAIAELVVGGYVRVILTTNFDRLLEEALAGVGIAPVVIDSTDDAIGALPLVHAKCTVVKLHGDYLDPRIRNTPAELASYDKAVEVLLDRVSDEYGLIVCGWSGDWDTALRAAIERCPNRRFPTYWATVGDPGDTAVRLVRHRGGEFIRITGADAFFPGLKERVAGLETFEQRHPLSEKMAVANVKRYIAEEKHRILLHDMVMEETERAFDRLSGAEFPMDGPLDFNTVPLRVARYEASVGVLLSIISNGCFWGEKEHEGLWGRCIERLAKPPGGVSGYVEWLHLRYYPATLALYAGGLAALASSRYETLAALLTKPKTIENGKEVIAASMANPVSVLSVAYGRSLPGRGQNILPMNEHVYVLLMGRMKELIPDEAVFEKLFNRFEYFLALACADHFGEDGDVYMCPPGRFSYLNRFHGPTFAKGISQEIEEQGAKWPLLAAGMFGGDVERLKRVKAGMDEVFAKMPRL